jgi:hypothetical protein
MSERVETIPSGVPARKPKTDKLIICLRQMDPGETWSYETLIERGFDIREKDAGSWATARKALEKEGVVLRTIPKVGVYRYVPGEVPTEYYDRQRRITGRVLSRTKNAITSTPDEALSKDALRQKSFALSCLGVAILAQQKQTVKRLEATFEDAPVFDNKKFIDAFSGKKK